MATENLSESEAFYASLGQELAGGGTAKSPEELLQLWRKRREYDDTVAELADCIADMEAGKGRPLAEFADEMPRHVQHSTRRRMKLPVHHHERVERALEAAYQVVGGEPLTR